MAKSYTTHLTTKQISHHTDQVIQLSETQRKQFARRWYDNNFFDDGYHFRFVHPKTGRVIDHTDSDLFHHRRAIPKASRQIRGMANLLQSRNFVPIIFPEYVSPRKFDNRNPIVNPQSQQPLTDDSGKPMTEYDIAVKVAKEYAQRTGRWIINQWDEDKMDIQSLINEMMINTMKHGVSFLQVWADPVDQAINAQAYDAFEIYLDGAQNDINDSPFMIKVTPHVIARLKANELFDQDQLLKINADNKYASDEIKEAYMQSRYGDKKRTDQNATLLLKEGFFKEYVDDYVMESIREQANTEDYGGANRDAEYLLTKMKIKKGDPIIRQAFSAGGVWLRDNYIALQEYPFVDLRLEPGKIYQTPQIERFIPANKALALVVYRVERHLHSMTLGIWTKRADENYNVTNLPGGQMITYKGTPPVPAPMSSIPAYVFNFMELLTSFIEEQGVTTTALGKLPKGVKANAAIESLKESEFANLSIAMSKVKKTVKRVAEKMLDIGDRYFIKPELVSYMENDEPNYFEVIGQSGVDLKKKLKEDVDTNMVPLKKDYKVQISLEEGLAHTPRGQQEAMKEIMDLMVTFAQQGLVDQKALAILFRKLLDTYSFGNTQEFMEAMDQAQQGGQEEVSDESIEKMKLAFVEVIKQMQDAEKGQQPPGSQSAQPQGGVA